MPQECTLCFAGGPVCCVCMAGLCACMLQTQGNGSSLLCCGSVAAETVCVSPGPAPPHQPSCRCSCTAEAFHEQLHELHEKSAHSHCVVQAQDRRLRNAGAAIAGEKRGEGVESKLLCIIPYTCRGLEIPSQGLLALLLPCKYHDGPSVQEQALHGPCGQQA